MSIKSTYNTVKDFITHDIWQLELDELSRVKARLVKYLKIVLITIRTFSAEKIGFQAVALSFFCTMAVVPFVAVTFAVTDGFGLSDRLLEFLYTYFSEHQDIIDYLLTFAENIITTAQTSIMGLLSGLLFVWLVIWMMICVERVFNNVWRVRKSRNLFKRLGFYILILILSPFVILLFFWTSLVYTNSFNSIGLGLEYFATISSLITWIIFYVISTLVFSVMYKFIPNYNVLYKHAFRAALFSGLVFTILQYGYLETQLFVSRLNMVYGAVAAIPLFMFWLNFGWFIILFGAELSYAFQNVNHYNIDVL